MTAYGVSKWPVILLLVTPGILYTPVTYLSCVLFARWSVYYVLKLAVVFQLIGSWTRAFSFIGSDFRILGLGAIIFSISNPLIVNSTRMIANLWFAEDERGTAAAIAGGMVPLGCVLGLALTGMLSTDVNAKNQS